MGVGVWPPAAGRITYGVDRSQVMFLPQTPLMAPQGSLLQQVFYPNLESAMVSGMASEHTAPELCIRALEAIREADLSTVVFRATGRQAGGNGDISMKDIPSTWDCGDDWVEQLSP